MTLYYIKRGSLIISLLFLTLATIISHRNPATSHELSIYSSTPVSVWTLIALSIALAMLVHFHSNNEVHTRLSIFVIALSAMVFVATPILRGYFFMGSSDPMTHLGWARDIFTGVAGAHEYDHVGVQLIVGSLAEIQGVPLQTSWLVVGLAFFLVFLLMIPLSLRLIVPRHPYLIVGIVTAVITLPLERANPLGSPRVRAYMFLPIILFFLLKAIHDYSLNKEYAILFVITSTALLTYHVEYPFYLLLVLIPVGAALLSYQKLIRSKIRFSPLYLSILAVGIISFWWTNRRDRVERRFANYVASVIFPDSTPEAALQRGRGETLEQLGASFFEVFIKLFAVDLLFILLTIVGTIILFSNRDHWQTRFEGKEREVLLYSLAAFGGGIFAIMVISGFMNSRYLGFLLVIVSLTGALGLMELFSRFANRWSMSAAKRTLYLGLAVILLLSAPIVFMSPFVYLPSGHVTEAQVASHEVFLDTKEEECERFNHRSRLDRFHDFIRGPNAQLEFQYQSLVLDYGQHLRDHDEFPGSPCSYLSLTSVDVELDIQLYDGLRFSQEDLQYLESDPSFRLVSDNGDHRVFHYSE